MILFVFHAVWISFVKSISNAALVTTALLPIEHAWESFRQLSVSWTLMQYHV